ncbi:hypothetical protein [Terribacillus sp. DMT04]|uniref:hypothetical protein n=1 Tax=Terribacillus sp. DMT04 TaxID=2850441 RepID=UPI001C2C85DE|nr:hypothetical protein [Terribacillus sp. DMT04]QXE02062.1 hypothetical protein KS242_02085 [Terribacillus sp. DMT04]
MYPMPPNQSGDLFEERLQELYQRGFISYDTYAITLEGYQKKVAFDASKSRTTTQPVPHTTTSIERKLAASTPAASVHRPPVQKQKKQKTPEQIRERNLTIILVLGIVMLFFGGLYLGTSNWGTFSSLGKVLLISLIPFLFAGLSFISYKVKIPQTAFAFLILAALFVPIVIFSASYYQLFGSYLSFGGDGAALVGTIAALGCTVLYYAVAVRTRSKAFIWVTYAGVSSTFISAMLYVTITYSAFLFCLQLANLLLLVFERPIRKSFPLRLLQQYWPYYLQMKLGTEAFITIVLMSTAVIYDLTLLVIGISALILAAKNYSKLYHFGFMIFTLISGVLLLLEIDSYFNMFLGQFLALGFTLVLLSWHLPRWLKIAYESLIHCINGFLFIIFTSLTGTYTFDWAYLLGLVFLFIQYTVWTVSKRHTHYSYPSTGLLLVIMYWLLYMLDTPIWLRTSSFATMAFLGLAYCYIWPRRFNYIKLYQRTVSWAAVGSVIPLLLVNHSYGYYEANSYLLLLTAAAGFFCYQKENQDVVLISKIITPISFIAALILAGYRLYIESDYYQQHFGIPGHMTCIALITVIAAVLFRRYHHQPLFLSFFLTGQIFQSLATILAFLSWDLPATTISIVSFISVIVQFAALYVFRRNTLWASVLVSLLLAYGSLQNLFDISGSNILTAYVLFCGAALLAVSILINNKAKVGSLYFFWCSHIINLFSIMWVLGLQSFDSIPPAWLLVPFLHLAVSAYYTKRTIEKHTFASASITILFLIAVTHLSSYTDWSHLMTLAAAITAICIAAIYKLLPGWQAFMRLSLLIVCNVVLLFAVAELTVLFSWEIVLLSIIVGVLAIYQQHHWQRMFMSYVTMLLLLAILLLYGTIGEEIRTAYLLLAGAVALIATSFTHYQSVLITRDVKFIWEKADIYRIGAVVYTIVGSLTGVMAYQSGWAEILFSMTVPAILFAISVNTNPRSERRYVRLGALFACLYPYMLLLQNLPISPYLLTELYVVPIALLVLIILRVFFYDPDVTPHIELILLAIGFGILVLDGLASMTIYDALSLGSISLLAAIVGFIRKYRAYFLTGTITVVFNLFFQTRPLWGSAPWWLYLIGAGFLLIASASYIEYQKHKHARTAESMLQAGKTKWKKWLEKYK